MIEDTGEIKVMRQKLGLTQTDLAKAAGVSQSLIAKIESGRLDPAFSRVKKISSALTVMTRQKDMTVKEIMINKVIHTVPEAKITDAIARMKKFGISQMPVLDDGKSIGIISERAILESLTEDRPHSQVKDVMTEAPPQLPPDASISAASKLLAYYPLVLVSERGRVKGLVTRSDILQKAFS